MASQFELLCGDVSKSAGNVSKSLVDMNDAVSKVDATFKKFSKTQTSTLEVSKKFQKAVDSLNKGLVGLGSAGVLAAKGLTAIGKAGETSVSGLASSMSGVSKEVVSLKKEIETLRDKIEEMGEASKKKPVKVSIDTKFFSKSIKEIEDEILVLKNDMGGFSDFEIIDKKIIAAQVKALKDAWDGLDDVKKKAFETEVAADGLESALTKLSGAGDALSIKLKNAAKKVKEDASSYKTLSEELKKASNVTDLLKSRFIEGRREAESYANGLGLVQNKSLAAGVAAFFLFQKAAELVDKFKDARVSLATYNVELAKMGKTTPGVDASQLEEYRDQLNLTRDQAKEFYKVLRDGAQSGVISVSEMVNAQEKLQQAYGGDQTGKLKEYVDLLNEIPTLDTDLKVTASMDDRAASLFDLAKKGKISTVMELQAAGLAGGEGAPLAPEDTEMLNTAQKTEKTVGDINAFLTTKLFPSWGPQFSAIAGYTFKTFSAIGGFAAVSGTLQAMMTRRMTENVRATRDVESAIRESSGGGGGGGGVTGKKGIAELVKTFKRSFNMSYGMRGGATKGKLGGLKSFGGALKTASVKTLTKAFPSLEGSVSQAVNAVKSFSTNIMSVTKGAFPKILSGLKTFAGAAAAIGAVLLAAGAVADWFGDKLEASGNKSAAAGSKFGGALLTATGTIASFAAVGALLGSFVPVIGNVVGGIAGALIGVATVVWNQSDMIGKSMEDWGKSLQEPVDVGGVKVDKYGPGLQKFGKFLEAAGPIVSEFGKEIKGKVIGGLTGLWEGTKTAAKFLWDFTNPIGIAIKALDEFAMSLQTPEYREAMKKNAEEVKKSSAAFKKAREQNEINQKKLQKSQEPVMKSAQSMERHFKATAAVVGSGKLTFADFQKDLGMLQMSIYRDVGGSGEKFKEAAGDAAQGISDRFDELQKGLRERRMMIIKDGTLDATARKQALLNLKNEELKSVKAFVGAMSEVITSMVESPDVMKKGMEMKIRQGQLDFSKDMGGFMTEDEVFNRLGKNMEDGSKLIEESIKGMTDANAITQKRREMMEKRGEAMSQDAVEAYKSLPPELQKRISSVVKMETKTGVGKYGGPKETTEIKGIDAEAAKKELKQLKVDMQLIQMEMDKSSKIIDTGSWGTVVNQMSQTTKAQEKLVEEGKAVAKLTKEAEKNVEKKDAAAKAEKDLIEKSKNLAQEQDNLQEKLNAVMAAKVGKDPVASKLLADMVKAGDTQVAHTTAQAASYAKAKAAFSGMGEDEKKITNEIDRLNKLTKRHNELAKGQGVLEVVASDEITLSNKELEDMSKNQENFYNGIKKLGSVIDETANAAVMVTAKERRLLESRQAETVMATQTGNVLGNISDINNANVDLYKKSLVANEKALSQIKAQKETAKKALELATTDEQKTAARATIAKAEEAEKNIKVAASALQQTMVDAIEGIDSAMTQAMKTPIGRKAGFDIDLSGAGMELAEFSETAMASVGDMVNVAKDAAKRRLDIEKAALDVGVENAKRSARAIADKQAAQLMKPVAEGGEGMNEAQAKAAAEVTYNSHLATIESEKQLKSTQMETKQKKDSLDAVEKATKLQMDQLDVTQGTVQAQLDLFETFGGTADELANMLNKDLNIEKGRLKLLKEQAAESRRLTQDSLATRKLELEVTKKESEIRKKDYENAKRVVELGRQRVGIEDELVQAQLDMAMDFGSSLSVVTALQNKQVDNARTLVDLAEQDLAIAEQKFKKGEIDGNQLRKAQVDTELARLNLTRKSMGVQRDIMDKMLASAFGGVRTSVGGRRQRGTDVAMMGVGETRVKSRSGMFKSAGPGGLKPYWQRQAELQAKGKGAGAKRMKPEEELAARMGDTAKSTKSTAKAASKTADSVSRGDSPGSFYTHDVTTEGYLASILYVAKEVAIGINDLVKGQGGPGAESRESAGGYIRKLNTGIENTRKEIVKKGDEANAKAKEIASAQTTSGKVEEKASNETSKGDVGEKANAIEKAVAKSAQLQTEKVDIAKKELQEAKTAGVDGSKMLLLENKVKVAEIEANKKDMAVQKENLKVQKKMLVFTKKDNKAFKSMMADEKGARKTLESFVKNGMEIGAISTPLGEMEFPKDISDSLSGMQKSYKESGEISPGEIETLAASVSQWGKQIVSESDKVAAEDKKAIAAEKKSQMGGGWGFKGGGKSKSIEQSFADLDKNFGKSKGKSIEDSIKGIGLSGKGGGGLGAKTGKGADSYAMIGFNKTADNMVTASKAAKETNLSSSDIADITARQQAITPVGGVQASKAMEAKPQFAGGGTAGGGGGGGAEFNSMRIEGQMTVHFDNTMFKDQVAAVVANLVKTPNFQKSIQDVAHMR